MVMSALVYVVVGVVVVGEVEEVDEFDATSSCIIVPAFV